MNSVYGIRMPELKPLGIGVKDLRRLTQEEVRAETGDQTFTFLHSAEYTMDALKRKYTDNSWASDPNHPIHDAILKSGKTEAYASIIAGGRVIATIDNQGILTDGDVERRFKGVLPEQVNGGNGPNLAQARAEKIAQMVGGSIRMADTAMTQSAFNSIPAFTPPEDIIDYKAMRADPAYQNFVELGWVDEAGNLTIYDKRA